MAGKSPEASSVLLFISLLLLLTDLTNCREILVGGKSNAWKVPSSPADSLNRWAEKARFHVGDTLLWKYDGEKDSVLRVTKEAYVTCNTTEPVAKFSGGETKVKLERHGAFFFISGSKTNCEQGEKLFVVVMSPRSSRGFFVSEAPSPSPVAAAAEIRAPAVAPTTGDAASSLVRGGAFTAVLVAVVLRTLSS
ncbi:PREDICTED: early nodulin-like protein 3 [Tarenaya hassleriana]|uniref:early nodulin-like protein 3 n=1 Tax=Tarenaya hassleriana TaxID=28532 RepID=UPI00053C4384|nr:PREDICTED: early nodulin-like protein 3 [Tarenaya hassleriana]